MKNRTKYSNTRSGGITLGSKNYLENYIELLNTDSDYVFWFKIKGILFNSESDIVFGIVYIPPEGTLYSSPDAFNDLEAEYLNFASEYDFICLTGDFNSRVSDENDFFLC